ncbi:putative 1-phosphofructokinase [Candidatus Microthrix parvicella RN1]|uniref:Putative 1-phosphofructokinase n=1 Tax=Candidatus Neomicrothrix parvicella RN1 TaxID=1229780 RepID=R4Z6N8_9ACTN|nr:putative 1-phosphofructokinase [Candidatus Microthrix parvicella RN1]
MATLHAAQDLFIELGDLSLLELEGVHLARSTETVPSGKGWNVARAMSRLEIMPLALVAVGADCQERFRTEASASGFESLILDPGTPTRTNVTIRCSSGVSHLRSPGCSVGRDFLQRVWDTLEEQISGGTRRVVLSGSLPPGVEPEGFAELLRNVRRAGCWVAVDSSGSSLTAAISAGVDLLKPNRSELEFAAGLPVNSPDDALAAATALLGLGVGSVVASLGAAGAVATDSASAWTVPAIQNIEIESDVGSGDTLMAGLVGGLAGGAALPDALALGVGCATASLMRRVPGDFDQAEAMRLRSLASVREIQPHP